MSNIYLHWYPYIAIDSHRYTPLNSHKGHGRRQRNSEDGRKVEMKKEEGRILERKEA